MRETLTPMETQGAGEARSAGGAPDRHRCDGETFKRLLCAATAWLERHAQAINALNVFPVPDGDTGTNMLLTMKAACAEVAPVTDHSVAAVARAAAHGALMGARGNSGVILSQILRGLARVLDNKETFSAADLAAALKEGSITAYQGVIEPVEGTMLTVSRDVATAALAAAQETDDLQVVLEKTVAAARASVDRTPSLLDVLREAGVVDAGGEGYYVILEGAARFLRGEPVEGVVLTETPAEAPAEVEFMPVGEGMQYGYCTEFILQGQDLNYEEIKAAITALGDSAIVVGDDRLIRVHVHTFHPGQVLEYATSKGVLRKIKIDNMQEQHREWLDLPLRVAAPPRQTLTATEALANIGVVVVSPGPGFTRVFESLGASAVVSGGQTMNPSTEEMLAAIESLNTDNVIVLPNNKNIIMVAQQAQQLTGKHVVVVPTRTVPQGIAALLALNYQADLTTNVQAMERALKHVRTAEITWATRSVRINGMDVAEGSVIGLLDDNLTASGPDIESVVRTMLEQMKAAEAEILTVYYGEDVTEEEAESLAAMIRAEYPHQEVELVNGGQPHYQYIISAE